MGTLERIRKTSPYLLGLFAVVFVGFMVISDMDPTGSFGRGGNNYQTAALATINDEDLLYRDFDEKIRQRIDQQREQQQPGQDQQIDDSQIRSDIWNEMVESILIKQEAAKAGIVVTDAQVLDILIDNPPDYLKRAFTDSTGNFNKRAYLEIITNPDVIYERLPQNMQQDEKKKIVDQYRNDLLTIEGLIRDQIMQQSLMSLVNTSTSVVSPLFAKQKYIDDNSNASVDFILFDTRKIVDSTIKISDNEAMDYYNKNKVYYEPLKPRVKVKFAAFPIIPSDKDTLAANKIVKKVARELEESLTPEAKDSTFGKLLHELQGETHDFSFISDIDPKKSAYLSTLTDRGVMGPVQLQDGIYFFRLDGKQAGANVAVDASHILIKFGTNKDSAKAEAMKILTEAKKGEDFSSLAIKYSEDKGSARQGGNVGFFKKGQMVKPFEDAAFAASAGSIVGPVESEFGYHIIKVNDKKSDELKYSEIKIVPEISRMTRKAIARNASELKRRTEEGESFDSVAKYFNKIARELPFFESTKPILGSLYLTSQAFAGEVGAVVLSQELERYGIIVLQVVEKRDEGIPTFEDKKDEIKSKLINIKKLDMIKSKAETAFKSLSSLDSLTRAKEIDPSFEVMTIDDIKNNGTVKGVGRDFVLTTKVMTLPIGKISGPIRGERGYYIVQVKQRDIPDQTKVNSESFSFLNEIRTKSMSNLYMRWFNNIKADAVIEDFRNQFYREY